MVALERDIAYDILGENLERSEKEIMDEACDEPLIEKSDITAMGAVVPDVLVTEEDEVYAN